MKSKVVAILETRTGAHWGKWSRAERDPTFWRRRRRGAGRDSQSRRLAAGAMGASIRSRSSFFKRAWGTRALFQATDAAGLTGELLQHLNSAVVVVAGRNLSEN